MIYEEQLKNMIAKIYSSDNILVFTSALSMLFLGLHLVFVGDCVKTILWLGFELALEREENMYYILTWKTLRLQIILTTLTSAWKVMLKLVFMRKSLNEGFWSSMNISNSESHSTFS